MGLILALYGIFEKRYIMGSLKKVEKMVMEFRLIFKRKETNASGGEHFKMEKKAVILS